MTDILTRIHSMKEELELLEAAVLQQIDKVSEAEPQEDAPIQEAEVEDTSAPKEAAEEEPAETAEETVFDFAEEEDMPDFEDEAVSEPVIPEQQVEERSVVEQTATEVPDIEQPAVEQPAAQPEEKKHIDSLVIDDELEVLPIGEALAPAKDAVMDKMAEKESWRTDMPGAKVSDIRSAISLNDRVLFINTLFHEDPIAFQNALSQINAMPSFDEGADFILGQHPEWNKESDVVYRFMMAVRRKLR